MELHTKILTKPDKTQSNKKHFRTPSSSSDEMLLAPVGPIKFPTMAPSTGCRGHSSKMFGGIAFGANVHISCHTDSDFMYSVVSAHLREHKNQLNDRILVYFCFPRLGTAIPLRSGDLLVFNPSEPHAVSSRCRNDDLVYCMSMYLKTSVVGLNDNSLGLTTQQLDAMNSHTS